MKKTSILLLSILILNSCKNKLDKSDAGTLFSTLTTENENRGANEILNYYGGDIEYSTGITISTLYGNKKYCQIEMRESDAIDAQLDIVYLPSSNIAYTFFKNLKEEKEKFDEIIVILISKDGVNQEFNFPIAILEKVEKRIEVAEKVANLLKQKKFEELKGMINLEHSSSNKNKIIAEYQKIESKLSNIINYKLLGFKLINVDDKNLIQISGILNREKQNTRYSIVVDLNSNKYELYRLLYEF